MLIKYDNPYTANEDINSLNQTRANLIPNKPIKSIFIQKAVPFSDSRTQASGVVTSVLA